MTKENRERAYKNFRNAEKNYTALEHLDNGITSTSIIKEKAGKDADALLIRNPELAESDKPPKPKETKKTSKGE